MGWINLATVALGALAAVAPQFAPFLSPHAADIATAVIGALNGVFHLFQVPGPKK